MISSQIDKIIEDGLLFLEEWIALHSGLGNRNFYGESFSLALFAKLKHDRSQTINLLKKRLLENDRADPEYHWEFNNYAQLSYLETIADDEIKNFLFPLKFKGTKCTNWSLLRSNVQLKVNSSNQQIIAKTKKIIKRFQLTSGLILDSRRVNSFQYHCFSASMIFEIYKSTGDIFFRQSFISAVQFIKHFILPNGDTLYIGRGQEQSFGYASLAYILSEHFFMTEDYSSIEKLNLIIKFLAQAQLPNGNIPLVIGGGSTEIPDQEDLLNNANFCGLYAYNNHFDYLPFTLFFLNKSNSKLKDYEKHNGSLLTSSECIKTNPCYKDSNYQIIARGNYIAIIAKGGGYWTNDLPIPLVYSNGEVLTPCYGGEQFVKSLYTKGGIPLPMIKSSNISLRDRALTFLLNKKIVVVSLFGILIRKFNFHDDNIVINNYFICPLSLFNLIQDRYLFFKNSKLELNFSKKIESMGTEYCTKGALDSYIFNGVVSKITLRLKK